MTPHPDPSFGLVDEGAPLHCPICGSQLLEPEDGTISLCPHALTVASNQGDGPSSQRGDGTALVEAPLVDEPWHPVHVTFEANPYNWSWYVVFAWPDS
ncbi:MAG: hypothetical protein KC621_17540 [Myxococcales bacterium]|nr:hypothetical protein [Myxococcales bacterium]